MSKKTSPVLLSPQGLSIHLTTEVDDEYPIHLAGTFNGWSVADPRFEFKKLAPRKYYLRIPTGFELSFPLEYKFVKGSWDRVELDKTGKLTPNRILEKPVSSLTAHVPLWSAGDKEFDKRYLPQITIISNHFVIPQLIKTRRVTALLPHDYYTQKKRYPVLYLQDGQNLFDDFTPYGSWGVDKKLAMMAAKGLGDIIIIAIDHANEERITEFTPALSNTRFKKKQGKKYIRFLADTLKPYVDQNFRTLPEVEHTGIGGSSMGGLISIYAGLTYPEVYSKLMIFSPSLWVTPNMYFGGIQFQHEFNTRIYLYAGQRESKNMIPNALKFKKTVLQKGENKHKVDFKLSIDEDGVHSEYHWGEEFPKAVKWLFFSEEPE